LTIIEFSLTISYVNFFFKFLVFFVLWKVSYNYLLDIKQIPDAPRIIKLQKIISEFSPEDVENNQMRRGSDNMNMYGNGS